MCIGYLAGWFVGWVDGWMGITNLTVIRLTSKPTWQCLNLTVLFLIDDNEKNLSLGLQTLRSLKVGPTLLFL